MRTFWKFALVVAALAWISLLSVNYASARFLNITAMISYSKSDYGNDSYSRRSRYSGSIAVNVTSITEIEAAYSYTDSFFKQSPSSNVKTNEQVLSLSVIQFLVPSDWFIQPYIKLGAAQYNRRQSGLELGIPRQESITKSPSGVLGGGLRVYIGRYFSLNAEGTGYLPDFKIGEFDKNFAISGGLGFHF